MPMTAPRVWAALAERSGAEPVGQVAT
jgi:hypothetical protein